MINTLRKLAGFTLIELVVVMGILGVLLTGIVVAVNPIEKINNANDSKMLGEVSAISRAAESYSVEKNSFPSSSTFLADLVTFGELKSAPTPPSGYTYTVTTPPGCTTIGNDCTSFTISTILKSNKYLPNNKFMYDSATGKFCYGVSQTSC